MTLQVLLSAMHLADESFLDTLHVSGDAVVINQCDRTTRRDTVREVNGRKQRVRYIETQGRGLSLSRNMAIRNALADICILCDNDVEYEADYEKTILSAFEAHPEADLIVFYIRRKEKPQPNYASVKKMGYLSVLKIFSPEIAFRRKSIQGLSFNEDFGAGSGKYLMGEENIFLYDCLRARKKILYVPTRIATLREEESTWFTGYDRQFFISRGAGYAAMSRFWSHLLIWQFALRKRKLYRENCGTLAALLDMYRGRDEYLYRKRRAKRR